MAVHETVVWAYHLPLLLLAKHMAELGLPHCAERHGESEGESALPKPLWLTRKKGSPHGNF